MPLSENYLECGPKARATTSSWPRSLATNFWGLTHRSPSARVIRIFTLKLEPLGCLERCRWPYILELSKAARTPWQNTPYMGPSIDRGLVEEFIVEIECPPK